MGEHLVFQCIFNNISRISRGSCRPSILRECNSYVRARCDGLEP